ncbi:InlB B-repeat-containing protein [Barnesiella viscericola]|uniref:InlB B-repeat-containing protein n=1 Tax=Barnesiella viscericola TaxID=397865 RepID=UPI002354356B|nr:InlB B-repeat-containing protein [Barnesiella viscericola]
MKKFLFFASLSIVAAWPVLTSAQSQQSQSAASEMNRPFAQESSYQSGTKAATGQITFHANGGKVAMAPVTNLSDGEELMLPRNTFVRDNYQFVGWTNQANSNEPIFQDEYPTFNYYAYNSDLYAVWEPASSALKLSFDANGGKGTMDPIYVRNGQIILVPPHQFIAPEEGYECKGYGNTPR